MIVERILSELERMVDESDRPLVIYSALWPLLRLAGLPGGVLAEKLCAGIFDRFAGLTLLMPTFTRGFNEHGQCDLDKEPSQTGALSEYFRTCFNVRRTRSAYFSFAVNGPAADVLASLNPVEAWGEGSLYQWLYDLDATIVTMGLHPTHCSFTHYGEWLRRDEIPYRFNKLFSGILVREGVKMLQSEVLLVRQRDPEPVNDFTWLLPAYIANGMSIADVFGYPVSCIGARAKIDIVTSCISADPFALVANREEFFRSGR